MLSFIKFETQKLAAAMFLMLFIISRRHAELNSVSDKQALKQVQSDGTFKERTLFRKEIV